ncbi:MAG TPA: hypothetical protein VGJ19_21505 [Streptosporangiaceae bacterium]
MSTRSAAGQATGPLAAAFFVGVARAARRDADGEAVGVAGAGEDGATFGDALGAGLTRAGDAEVAVGVL